MPARCHGTRVISRYTALVYTSMSVIQGTPLWLCGRSSGIPGEDTATHSSGKRGCNRTKHGNRATHKQSNIKFKSIRTFSKGDEANGLLLFSWKRALPAHFLNKILFKYGSAPAHRCLHVCWCHLGGLWRVVCNPRGRACRFAWPTCALESARGSLTVS